MSFSGVDWNDFIGDFIKIKAEKPHLLNQMIKREEDYQRMKESQRKIKRQAIKYDNLTSQLQNQISNFNKIKIKKQRLIQELNTLQNEIQVVQFNERKQVSIKIIRKRGRSDLLSSRRTQRSNQNNLRKEMANLTVKYENEKNELKNNLSEYIAHRINLKEQLQRVTDAHNTFKSNQAAILEYKQIRQKIQILKAQNAAARQKRGNLYQQHKKWLSQSQKPQKKQKMLNDMFQQSKKNIKQAFKDIKKFLLSDQPRYGKKYDELMNKMSRYKPIKRSVNFYKQLDRQFYNLQEKHRAPPFYDKNKVDLQQLISKLRQTMELEDIEESFTIKSKTQQEIADFYQSYESLQQYLKQRVRIEESTDQQIQSRRVILQRKVKDIQLSKERMKSQRSV